MAEKTSFAFPFAVGMNEKPSGRAQAVGEMRAAENIRISKAGEFNKRKGFKGKDPTLFGGGTAPSNIQASAAYNDELIVFDGESAFSQYEDGKLKERGTCVNVRGHKSNCNTSSNSIDGAPAYSTIRDGVTNEIYEIMVWESRPFGADDIESKRGTYPDTDNTHNYRNKPSKLLYSVRHRDSGVFVINSQPIVHDGKDFVDRDLLLGKDVAFRAAVRDNRISVKGYGTASAIDGGGDDTYKRNWESVGSLGNILVLSGRCCDEDNDSRLGVYVTNGVEDESSELPINGSPTTEVTVRPSDRDGQFDYHDDIIESPLPTGTPPYAYVPLANVETYLNVEHGQNSIYFTTKPMLFNMADGNLWWPTSNTEGSNVVLVFASQYSAGEGNDEGLWSIYQANWDFSSGVGNAQISTPTVLTDLANDRLALNFKTPIWDADLYHSADVAGTESSVGIIFSFMAAVKTGDSAGKVHVQYYKFDGTDLTEEPVADVNLESAIDPEVLTPGREAIPGKYPGGYGGNSPFDWTKTFIPTCIIIKGINKKHVAEAPFSPSTNGCFESNVDNVFVVVIRSDTDEDIMIHSGNASWDGEESCAFSDITKERLLKYDGAAPVYPNDLQMQWELDGTKQPFNGLIKESGYWQCKHLDLVNAAVTNWSTSTSDAIYIFVEVAAIQYGSSITWESTATDGGMDNSRYIQSENRWVIRRNLNDENDTKVLLRNVNILSDAVYPTAGSRAYFCGHSVFDGDNSTSRTALFNDEGEVVAVFAAGDSALCHPYEMKQVSANVDMYPNYPMFSLRSRLSYYAYPGHEKYAVDGPYSSSDGYYDMEFGISTIDNATNAFQYNGAFNPKIASFNFQPPRMYQSQQVSGSLFTGSGLLWSFSGGRFIENGFLQKPLIQKITIIASKYSLGGVADEDNDPGCRKGRYTIAAAYFYKDDNGITHYSALDYYGNGADIDFVEVDARAKKLRIRVTGIQLTNKRTGIARKDHAGQTINEVESSSAGIAIFVGMSNTEIRGEEIDLKREPLQLYTMVPMDNNHRYHDIDIDSPNGVVQFRDEATAVPALISPAVYPVQPSCPTDLTSHKNILCISTTDGMIYPSQSFASTLGSEQSMLCPLFSVGNIISISEETNGVGASHIESNGPNLIAFNRNNVFGIAGDGPGPDNSSRSGFTPPQIALLDQGIDDRSICARIPSGIMYKSRHGYYLIGNEGLKFIGAPVEDYNDFDPSGVQIVDETNEIVIPLRTYAQVTSTNSTGGEKTLVGGVCLVYNYEFNQWYTWVVPTGDDQTAIGPYLNDVQGLIRSNGSRKLYFAVSNGDILTERDTHYTDELASDGKGYPVPIKIKTGQIKIGEFFSGFRLHNIGIPIYGHSETTLTIKLYYDGSSVAAETFTATLADGTNQSEIILKPAKQKCRTIAVDIEEDATNNESTDRGATLNGLGLLASQRTVKMPYNVAISKVPEGS